MAWTTEITVTDLAEKRIKVAATRTDGADVRTYSFDTIIDPNDVSGSKAAALATVKALRTEEVDTETLEATLLSGWESQLNSALDAWETE